jgi:actin related protein 2/3 complex subunit 2
METAPADGFNYALQFDCDNLPGDATQFLNSVSELKRHIAGGPLDRAFDALQAKKVDSVPRLAVQYRKSETMYIVPGGGKVLVVFQVDFADVTDRALARVFLQEFVEAQRSVRSAPSVGFSKEPPAEIAGLPVAPRAETAGYISFSVDDRFVAANNKDKTITLLVGFRNYLHYHIKCSKTYLHMRMRKRVAGWMLVLNRALPEVEGEKKTAAGKTFARK